MEKGSYIKKDVHQMKCKRNEIEISSFTDSQLGAVRRTAQRELLELDRL